MQWLLANLFLLAIVLIGAGLFWLVGFTMWSFNLPPDDHPAILMIGAIASLFATYYVCKWLYHFIEKRV